ncbi:MAG: glycosyl hydrolase, partial [Planctomycetes bacterium SM23_25]
GVVPAHRGYLRPVGQWNFEEVVCKGSRVTVSVNGAVIVDADLAEFSKPIDGQEHPGLKRTSGHIGFMGHGDRVEFRNIRVKRLGE